MHVMKPESLHERLRWARDRLNLNQEDVAQQLHVEASTFSRYETGKTEIPVSRLQQIASALQVSLTWLLAGEGDITSEPVSTQNVATPETPKIPIRINAEDTASTVEALLANVQALTTIIQRNQELEAQRLANEQERIRVVETKEAEKAILEAETKKIQAEESKIRTEQDTHMARANELAQETLQRMMHVEQFPHEADFPGTSEVEATASGR